MKKGIKRDKKMAMGIVDYLERKGYYVDYGEPLWLDWNGIDLLIVANWNEIPRKIYDFLESLQGIEMAYEDEVVRCSKCGCLCSTQINFQGTSNYIINEDAGEIYCASCIDDEPELLIDAVANNNEKAAPIWAEKTLLDAGFQFVIDDRGDIATWTSGFDVPCDKPEEILDELWLQTGIDYEKKYDLIWIITNSDPFRIRFALMYREKKDE